MKKLLFIGLVLLATLYVAGQEQNVDSLVNVLETNKLLNNEQLQVYVKISEYFIQENYNFEKGISYANEGLSLAEKEKDKLMLSSFNNYLGVAYLKQSSYDTALIYLNKSLEWATNANDKNKELSIYSNLGTLYKEQGNYSTALEYYLQALDSNENNELTAKTYANIGHVHQVLMNFDRAIDYYNKALEIAEQLNSDNIKMGVFLNLGSIYSRKEELDKMLEYNTKALDLSRKLKNKLWENACLMQLATYFHKKNDYEQALKYAKEGLLIAEELGTPQELLDSYATLANLYINLNRYQEADIMAMEAWKTDSTTVHFGAQIASMLVVTNINLGNKEKAMRFLRKCIELFREGNAKSLHDSLSEMEVKYETEKKEIRIASLEKERQLYVWLGVSGGLLVVALVVMLLLTVRNARKQRRLIAAESLQAGEIGERARIAEDLHDRLGGSLSAARIGLKNAESLQTIGDKIDDCIKEVREITNNIMPRSLRLFGIKGALEDLCVQFLNVRFHFFGEDRRVQYNLEYAMYCCARELVSNAQKHSGAEHIDVQLVQGKKHLSLTVADDGCGFDEKNVVKGDGLQNVRNRVASCRGKLDISSSPGRGTETVIELRVEN